MEKKLTRWLLSLIGILIGGWLGIWLWLLASPEPLNHPLSRAPLWPVVCTMRGCIPSSDWLTSHQRTISFARATNQKIPSPSQTLTTVIRQHLVNHASLRSPVSLADARRYREEILHVRNEAQVKDILNEPLSFYDEQVILPFLQQEALKQQHRVESTEELYTLLSQDRAVVILLFRYRWDADRGEVVASE